MLRTSLVQTQITSLQDFHDGEAKPYHHKALCRTLPSEVLGILTAIALLLTSSFYNVTSDQKDAKSGSRCIPSEAARSTATGVKIQIHLSPNNASRTKSALGCATWRDRQLRRNERRLWQEGGSLVFQSKTWAVVDLGAVDTSAVEATVAAAATRNTDRNK